MEPVKALGVAFTAVGAAGIKFSADARTLNASLAEIGITLGVSTGEMRDLALATTSVDFPLKEVSATFDILSRAGVKSTEDLKNIANAFDGLADATGGSADNVAAELIPAFKALGVQLPQNTKDLDSFTWLTKNTTVDLGDFSTVVQRLAPEMSAAGISMDDVVIALATLESRGVSGRKATQLLGDAIKTASDQGVSLATALGLTSDEVETYKAKLDGATGITDQYATAANSQYGIMDKLKQTWSEITFRMGSFLTPLEPILAGMTALGPLMIALSTATGMAAIKTSLHVIALIAQNVALIAGKAAIIAVTAVQWLWNAAMDANPIGVLIIAIGGLIAAGTLLVTKWKEVTGVVNGWADSIHNFFHSDAVDLTAYLKDQNITLGEGIAKWGSYSGLLMEASRAQATAASSTATLSGLMGDFPDLTDAATKAMDWYSGAVENAGNTVKDYSKALQDLMPSLEKLKSAYEYEHSQLGQLGISYDDIVKALIARGIATDAIGEKMAANNVKEGDAIGLARIYAGELGDLTQLKVDDAKATEDSAKAYDDLVTKLKAYNAEAQRRATEAAQADIDAINAKIDAENTAFDTLESNLKTYRDDCISAAKDRATADIDAIDKRITAENDAHDTMMGDLRDYYADVADAAKNVAQEEIDAIDDRMTAERNAHDERMGQLDAEYKKIRDNIDAQLGIDLGKYQDQIDAIDAQIDAEAKARKEQSDNEKIASLQSRIANETDADKRQELQQELNDFLTNLAEEKHRQDLEDQKDAIRDQMDAARKAAEDAQTAAETAYTAAKTLADKALTDTITNLETEKTAKEKSLTDELALIASTAQTAIDKEQARHDNAITNLGIEKTTIETNLAKQIAGYNTAYIQQAADSQTAHNAIITNLTDESTARQTALTDQLGRYTQDLAAFNENIRLKLESETQFVKDYNALVAQLNQPPVGEVSTINANSPFSSITSATNTGLTALNNLPGTWLPGAATPAAATPAAATPAAATPAAATPAAATPAAPAKPSGLAAITAEMNSINAALMSGTLQWNDSVQARTNELTTAYDKIVNPSNYINAYATGGLIPEPTLLYGMKSQRVYAKAGEAGPERVSPMGVEAGTQITNNFNIASLIVREDADVPRIAQELYKIQRLRGFAYGKS